MPPPAAGRDRYLCPDEGWAARDCHAVYNLHNCFGPGTRFNLDLSQKNTLAFMVQPVWFGLLQVTGSYNRLEGLLVQTGYRSTVGEFHQKLSHKHQKYTGR